MRTRSTASSRASDEGSREAVVVALAGDPLYQAVGSTGAAAPLADVRLLAPVIPRSKVVGIGKNYADHAAEMGGEAPAEPLMFLKPNTVGGRSRRPGRAARASPHEVHYEGELAVVIGRLCKDVPEERVADVVYGYTCANDVTARDLQRSDGQWARAKGFDTFCPLGPWIETELDVTDLRAHHAPRRRDRAGRPHRRLIHAVADAGRLRLGDDDAAARAT